MVPIGSGTFVRRTDEQHGILTAGRVIGAIRARGDGYALPAQNQGEVCWPRIEAKGMAGYGENNREPSGADIGWIPLSAEEAETMEAIGAVFLSRAKERRAFKQKAIEIRLIFGFVEAARDLEENMVRSPGLLLGGERVGWTDEEGWDYNEYAIMGDDPWIPPAHGGVSGSAVWVIKLPMDRSARTAQILDGVAFAEGSPEDRKFIVYGGTSIRIALGER